MTTAVSEILTQTELLSAAEQLELAARLMEQAQQNVSESDEIEEGLDVFSLNHVPPKDSYVVMMKFVDAGRGEPTRYDFSEIFGDEEEESAD
ncbi:MAG: hypothetical protein ACREBD_29445 [Blastocatellia bacterium]